MAKVAIIMSAYNGTRYIKEQIDSILAQAYQDFVLYIRDDCSKDGTFDVLKNTYGDNEKVKLIKGDTNLGFGNSFGNTLRQAFNDSDDFEYFAFCDQDDYWETNKIQSAVDVLSQQPQDLPFLFASNYYICDSELNIRTICNAENPMKGVTFQNMFFEGVFPGFTIVINRRLAEMAFMTEPYADIFYHDKWVSLIALGCGGNIFYEHSPLAKYRRHEEAASSTDLGLIKKIQWRVNNVLNGNFCPRTRKMLVEYKTHFYDDISSSEIREFLDIFAGNRRFKKLNYGKHLRRSSSGEFLLRAIILLGKL